MSPADLIESARKRLAHTEEAVEVIREMYFDCADARQSSALLEAFGALHLDRDSQRDYIASLTKDQA